MKGGGDKLLAFSIAWIFKIIKNLSPSPILKRFLHQQQDKFLNYTYNYISAKDYIKKYNLKDETYKLNDLNIYVLRDFYVTCYFGCCSYIHDKNKNILVESCESLIPRQHRRTFYGQSIDLKKRKINNVDEAVNFVLESNSNYWHFSFTVLPKIIDFENAGFSGQYMIPDTPYIRELVKLTGIPDEKFLFLKHKEVYKISKLYIVDYCYTGDGSCHFANPESLQRVRQTILKHIDLKDINKYPKKLYVKRIGRRKIINEEEIFDILQTRGYQAMIPEEHSVEEQIKYFYAADIVVCPHGANSTNALYMKPDTNFIEVFGRNYVAPCVLDIIKCNKLNYKMVVEKNSSRNVKSKNGQIEDYYIEFQILDAILYNLE